MTDSRLNLDPIFEATDLIQLVEQAGAAPRKSGAGYTCACPLHHGTKDNFSIYEGDDGRWRWHCFSDCQAGGDALDFVQRWKGLDFTEAVKLLADQARISMGNLGWTAEAVKAHERQVGISELLTFAANFYSARLWNGDDARARDYARSRGFSEEHLRAIKWGYSRSDDCLLSALLEADNTSYLSLAREIGLVRADKNDFTANADGRDVSPDGWLIYPHWHNGKVVYLSARALSKVEKGSKSRNLPGARHIYRADRAIDGKLFDRRDLVIVEGPADAETVRGWGWPAWALMGCSLKEDDNPALVAELRRRASRGTIYIGLSNDMAGSKATPAVAAIAGPLSRLIWWPSNGSKGDANDWLQHGGTADDFLMKLNGTQTFLDSEIGRVELMHDTRHKAEGLEHLAGLVAQLGETERKMYLRTIGQQRGLNISQRDFEKMIRERMEGDPKSGIEIKNNQFYYWGEPLSNFVCHIQHELSRDNGQDPPEILYTVAGKLAAGEPLHPIDVSASDFDGLSWIGGSWGARPIVYIGGGKMHVLRRAIKEFSMEKMTREKIYTFTGWHEIGKEQRFFLSASGALSARGLDSSVGVDLPGNLARYSLPAPPYGGELVEAIQASLSFLDIAHLMITAPLFCAMYAAPLTPFKSLNALIWVYGPTQSKKSSIAHLAKCHFGDFVIDRDYKSVKDWTSSAADLEGTMFDCKDVPLIIDDYAPQFTDAVESRKQAKTAHYVVRSVGNRSSRGRRRADMSAQKQFIPRGLVLATAEQPLIGQSIVGRTIFVEVEMSSVDLDRLTEGQHRHHLYRLAMSSFIAWVGENWDRLSRELPAQFASLQQAAQFQNQDRLADYFAILKGSADLMLDWAVSVGAISQQDAGIKSTEIEVSLLDLLSRQSSRISGQSPVLRFFSALEDLINQGDMVMPDRTQEDFIVPPNAALAGWQDREKGQLLILTGPTLVRVKEYWNKLDERYDTLIDALRREIYQYDLLADKAPRQFERVKWINKKWGATGTQRVLVVDARKVRDLFDIDLLSQDVDERRDPEASR